MAQMKASTKEIFNYVKEHNSENVTAADVAKALGMSVKSVNGSFTSFQKKGWGIRKEDEITLDDGTHKSVKYLHLTDDGMNLDLESDE